MTKQFIIVYLENILVYSETEKEHLAHLRKVFERSKESYIYFKLKLCELGKTEVKHLGHMMVGSTVSIGISKT